MSSPQSSIISSCISSFLLFISLIITVTTIMSIAKYSMAVVAVSKGDVVSAADIMSERKYASNTLNTLNTLNSLNTPYQQPVYETIEISKTNSIIIISVIWCLVILGTSLYMYFSNKLSREMKNVSKWSTTDGIVTFSNITSQTTTSTTGSGTSKRKTYSTQYAPDIGYEYTVNNIKYNNNKVYPNGGFTNMQSTAQKYSNEKPVGKKIKVIYNVNNPSESFLEYDQGTSFTYPVLSILCATLICGFLFNQCYNENNCLKTYNRIK